MTRQQRRAAERVAQKQPISDQIVGIFLHNCRDPRTGVIEPWAWKIMRYMNSYTEINPLGTGVQIFSLGTLPDGVTHAVKENYEMCQLTPDECRTVRAVIAGQRRS